MLFSLCLLLNPGFIGDNQQVQAIHAALERRLPKQSAETITFPNDKDPLVPERLEAVFAKKAHPIMVCSGTHALELLQNPMLQAKIAKQRTATAAYCGRVLRKLPQNDCPEKLSASGPFKE